MFVLRQQAAYYIIDLPTPGAARDLLECHRWFVLCCGTTVQRCLAGYTILEHN